MTAHLVFVNACEDSVMVNDVITRLNPLIVLVTEEKLEETSFYVKCFPTVTRRKIVQKSGVHLSCSFGMDHQLSPNPHVLTIFLDFFPTCGTTP